MSEEELRQKRAHVHDRIKRMCKEEKVAEFRHYLIGSDLLRVDVDRIMADQAAVGAPDSALDDALVRIAEACGSMFGTAPLTAQELVDALKDQAPALREWHRRQQQGLVVHEPEFTLRRKR